MVRQAGIKTERIRSGMYQLYYKHHSPIIWRIDNIGWQVDAELPDIDSLIKKLTSDEFIEKKIKDVLGDDVVDGKNTEYK